MIKKIGIIFLLFLMANCGGFSQQNQDLITYEGFKKIINQKEIQIIDVRTLREYQSGCIKNAIHINVLRKTDFLTKINDLDKNKPTYLYCKSGVRSGIAFKLMEKAGFKNLYNYKGGYNEWKNKTQVD